MQIRKTINSLFSYGENSELPQDVDASASASIQKWNDENTGNTGIVAHIIQRENKSMKIIFVLNLQII